MTKTFLNRHYNDGNMQIRHVGSCRVVADAIIDESLFSNMFRGKIYPENFVKNRKSAI